MQGGEAATIEFALGKLNVEHIILCGHSHCGAIEAALTIDTLKDQPQLYAWIDNYITSTLTMVHKNYQDLDTVSLSNIFLQEHVLQQVENIKTHPLVNKAIIEGKVNLHAWIYRFEEGNIYAYNQQDGQFELIKHF